VGGFYSRHIDIFLRVVLGGVAARCP
jgi:hypothetical protein